jgi:hypothetical protein
MLSAELWVYLAYEIELFFDGDYLCVYLWEGVLGGLFDGERGIRLGKDSASAVEVSWVL